jgi:hypothetical protein
MDPPSTTVPLAPVLIQQQYQQQINQMVNLHQSPTAHQTGNLAEKEEILYLPIIAIQHYRLLQKQRRATLTTTTTTTITHLQKRQT